MAEPKCLADRYELRELLGRGGMGEVYDGWDRRLARPVAIKLLNTQVASRDEVRARFESEARAAARLSSPKVVRIFDTGEHEGVPYIVMERLPGRTLADEMAAGPLSQQRVRSVLLDMLEALAFAHRAGVLHRDIKPSNVLLTEDGTAKIADFGIAKIEGQILTQTGHFVGTATYLAPERLKGLPAGPESDLYSTGIVAYEALTGERPFQADTPLGLIRAINDDPVPPIRSRLTEVDEDLASTVDRATLKLPEDRFHTAEEMIEALGGTPARASAEGAPTLRSPWIPAGTEVLPTAPGDRPRRTPHLSFRWAALAVAAVLLLAVIFRLPSDDGRLAAPAIPSPQSSATQPGVAGGAERRISGVDSIEFLGPGTLVIEQTGSENSVTVEAPGELESLVGADISGRRLTVGLGAETAPDGVGGVVYRVKVSRLVDLRTSGGGTVVARNISGDSLTVENSGSTDIEMTGRTGRLTLLLKGSGNFEGTGFQAGSVTAELTGSGDAVVAVSERLQARLSGSGNLEYSGDPEVEQIATGSGEVEKAG